MPNVVIHKKKLLLEDFFSVEEATFSLEKADGKAGAPMRRLILDRGDSVAAVIVDVEREMLLLARQFRYATLAKGPGWLTELVAGMVRGAEAPEEAIRREILEEIGYRVSHLEQVSIFYLSPGGSSERLFLFYAEVHPTDRVAECERPRHSEEDIVTVEVPLAELPSSVATFGDAKTIIGLTWLAQQVVSSGRVRDYSRPYR